MALENIKVGISPIGWTNDDMPELGKNNTFNQTIHEMSVAGFAGTELGNKYPKNAILLKNCLNKKKLKLCNAWFSTFFVTQSFEENIENFVKHLKFLQDMGAKIIGCSEQGKSIQLTKTSIQDKPYFSKIEWGKVIKGYNELCKIASQYDIKLCLHHHMGTGIQNIQEIDFFLEQTNDQVGLLFDTGHIYYAEKSQENIVKLLNRYFHRIFHVHLKDVRQDVMLKVYQQNACFLESVKAGVFTVPGDGVINFLPIFNSLREKKYRGWVVIEAEQDPEIANPLHYAIQGRKYVQKFLGV